ncbi:hypothetical protein DPMN_072933 [Dreissena polymorpha]|uniref:Uncharacterized protein n=1 Tax=Dreissena polymorpha TaxID=45954 RepID=A0A9D4BY46_DREPO|nr:hypothetical protein DPMN_072933 [Dreissena polymorpha]
MSITASVLRYVLAELKQLKEAGRGATTSTAYNENNNTCVSTVHMRVGDPGYDLRRAGECRDNLRVGNRRPDVRESQPEPLAPDFLSNGLTIGRSYDRQVDNGQSHAQPEVSNTRFENAPDRFEYPAPV